MDGPGPRTIATWQAPLEGGGHSEELLVSFDRSRARRVLIAPALFDEANKLRRFAMQTMRAADALGVDMFLPDLPGCNESLQPLEAQTLTSWRMAVQAAADTFQATHVLAIRGGALLAPQTLTGWHYAPLAGPKLLRGMIRARTIAGREAGREESVESLQEEGNSRGLTLAGWSIGSAMFRELGSAQDQASETQTVLAPKDIGGAALWLRAEPGEDEATSQALAAIMTDSSGEAE